MVPNNTKKNSENLTVLLIDGMGWMGSGADTGFKWGRGGQDFLGTKKLIIRKKNVAAGEFFFFWLKRLKKSQN